MSGRRLRNTISVLVQPLLTPGQQAYVTISGLATSYSSYVTTFEEYQAQRYEAASTLYGPDTLSGYLQEYTRIAKDLVAGTGFLDLN